MKFSTRPAVLALAACALSCTSSTTTDAPSNECVLRVDATSTGAVLHGSGSCAGDIPVTLRVATGNPLSPTWTDAAGSGLAFTASWSAAGPDVSVALSVSNTGTAAVDLVGMEWTLARNSARGARMLHNGYQSWSYTGVEVVPALVEEMRGTVAHGGDNGDELGEKAGISWWWTWVSNGNGDGVVVGARSASVFKSYVGVERSRIRLVMGVTGDALKLAPGSSAELDGFRVGLGALAPALERYAADAAAASGVPSTRPAALGGWGSWNLYYADLTAEILRGEAAWMADTLLPLGLADFLMDDGYEPRWGEWATKPTFGADLGILAAEQTNAGLVPAIWLAPFMVEESAAVVTDHPEYFLHTASGALRRDNLAGGQRVVHLDLSQAGAVQHLAAQVQALWAAGYRTFKIDFLYSGAIEGVRSQDLTSIQAYRLGMQAIRNAVPVAHLVGCGAPLLPSAGMVDSMRTGPDIAFTVAPGPAYVFQAGQARHNAHRAITDHWWHLDPDVVLLRGTGITDAEAWTAVVSQAMTGGNYLLGDGQQLSPRRLAMAVDPSILAMTRDGIAARPGVLDDQEDVAIYGSPLLDLQAATVVPHTWWKTSADGGTTWVGVFAWSRDSFTLETALPENAEELLPPADDMGSVTAVPVPAGDLAVQRHAARLFRFHN